MDVPELLIELAIGELSNLSLAEGGVISDLKKPTIIQHANEALIRLYTRFVLKDGTVLITMTNDRTTYPLESLYAQSNTDVNNHRPRFINDLNVTFTDDVMKIMAVYDGNGKKLPLNDANDYDSVFTPQPAVLQVPHPNEALPLGIIYQAGHPKLLLPGTLVGSPIQVLELPDFLVGALKAYVAYKVFDFMGGQENTAKAQEHRNTYESICIDAVEQGLVTTGWLTSGLRFVKNGWV